MEKLIDVTFRSPKAHRQQDRLSSLAPVSKLIILLKQMVVAMGLPETVFEERASGLFVTTNEVSTKNRMGQIALWRNISADQKPLLQILWSKDQAAYLVTKTIDDPIAPMGNMLASLVPDKNGRYTVTEEQAMKMVYTMLRYLEVENRNSVGTRTGLPRTAIQTA